jgi:transglutaminase/protease-like cytokinesis protein 3
MKNQNLIHVKLEEDEALKAKRDLLTSEENLLEAVKSMRRYFSLRKEELKLKIRFSKSIKNISLSMKKIENNLPEMNKTPALKKLKKREEKKTVQDKSLETELNEIRDRLRAINNR